MMNISAIHALDTPCRLKSRRGDQAPADELLRTYVNVGRLVSFSFFVIVKNTGLLDHDFMLSTPYFRSVILEDAATFKTSQFFLSLIYLHHPDPDPGPGP